MEPYLFFGITLTAVAAGVAGVLLTVVGGMPAETRSEADRRSALRAKSFTFRWFEPTVLTLAGVYQAYAPKLVARLQHHLEVLDEPHWRADELLAAKQIDSVLVATVGAVGGAVVFGPELGVVLGVLLVGLFPLLAAHSFKKKAAARVNEVRARLPFAMDLMALLLEAGAGTLRECFERVGDEHHGQPLGDEIRRTLYGVEKGADTGDMLKAMDRRLADPDVKEIVQAITTAEDRGIALKDALRGLADRMRQRKVQWMEKSAEQAKVKITGPAMVTMVACLITVVAPLVLNMFGMANQGR
jgi:Flp pilus assembly protein TadB